jgi:hypothetical protein
MLPDPGVARGARPGYTRQRKPEELEGRKAGSSSGLRLPRAAWHGAGARGARRPVGAPETSESGRLDDGRDVLRRPGRAEARGPPRGDVGGLVGVVRVEERVRRDDDLRARVVGQGRTRRRASTTASISWSGARPSSAASQARTRWRSPSVAMPPGSLGRARGSKDGEARGGRSPPAWSSSAAWRWRWRARGGRARRPARAEPDVMARDGGGTGRPSLAAVRVATQGAPNGGAAPGVENERMFW